MMRLMQVPRSPLLLPLLRARMALRLASQQSGSHNAATLTQLCFRHTLAGPLRSINTSRSDRASWSHSAAFSDRGTQHYTRFSNHSPSRNASEPLSLSPQVFEQLYMQAITEGDADAADALLDEARQHSLLTSSMLQKAVATCLQNRLYHGAETLVVVANETNLRVSPAACEQVLEYMLLADAKATCVDVLAHMLKQGHVPSERTLREVGFRICGSGKYHLAFDLLLAQPHPSPALAHLFKTPTKKRVLSTNNLALDRQTAQKALQTMFGELYNKPNGQQLVVDAAVKHALIVTVLAGHRDVALKTVKNYLASGIHSEQHMLDTIFRLAIATIKSKDCAGCTEVLAFLVEHLRGQQAWRDFPKLFVEVVKEVWVLLHFSMGFIDKGERSLPANALPAAQARQLWQQFVEMSRPARPKMISSAIRTTLQSFTHNYHNPVLAQAALKSLYDLGLRVDRDMYIAAMGHCYRALSPDVAWQIINAAIEREDDIPGDAWEMALMLFEVTNKDEFFRPAMQRLLEEQKFVNSAACQIMLSHFALRGENIGWTIATRLYRDKKLNVTRGSCIDLLRLIRKSNPVMRYYVNAIVGNRKVSEFLRFHDEGELDMLADTVIARHENVLPEKFSTMLKELWPQREDSEARKTLYSLLHSAFSRRGLRNVLEDYQFIEVLQDLQTVGSIIAYLHAERDERYREAFDLLYVMGIIRWENPQIARAAAVHHHED